MLKQNKIIVKKFLLSIKNAVMAMSVESLKESSIQEVLDNFKAMKNLKDSGFDMDSPIVIKVGERKELKVLPSSLGNKGDIPRWAMIIDDENIAALSKEGNSAYIQGLSEGRTMIYGTYITSMDDPGEESSIEVVVKAADSINPTPAIEGGDSGSGKIPSQES